MKRLFFVLSTIFALFLSGCQYGQNEPIDPTKATLEIYIYGTLSSKPRENITITLFNSKEDAQNNVNAVSSKKYTNESGLVQFINLNPNTQYWVRIKPTISYYTELSPVLVVGYNYMEKGII
jgi:hypothetical protein